MSADESGPVRPAIDFNEATARALERMYSTPDVALQRALVLHAMALRAGIAGQSPLVPLRTRSG